MPVLTDFLPTEKLNMDETEKKQLRESVRKIDKLTNSVQFMQEIGVDLDSKSKTRESIEEVEENLYRELWKQFEFVPKKLITSCLRYEKMPYNYLADLSQYPEVSIRELVKIADSLSFMIIPIDYIDMEEVIKMYKEENPYYGYKIRDAYEEFATVIEECEEYTQQQIYMLAPISFYDPWREVSNEENISKYFSKKLSNLSTTMGMVIPTQRNLYKMIKSNKLEISEIKSTMEENFQMMQKSINECHRRIDWVQKISEERAYQMNLKVFDMEKQINELKYKLYCLLDPIIFSVDSGLDMSEADTYETEKARIGLCFGTEMPIDFFVQNGMTTVNDKRLKSVTHILNL